jgi:hypothetical protein
MFDKLKKKDNDNHYNTGYLINELQEILKNGPPEYHRIFYLRYDMSSLKINKSIKVGIKIILTCLE